MPPIDDAALMTNLRAAIVLAMESKDISLRELSRLTGIAVGSLHHWIGSTTSGTQNAGKARFTAVAAVAIALGISLDAILKSVSRVRRS